jgi:hypothetical protein
VVATGFDAKRQREVREHAVPVKAAVVAPPEPEPEPEPEFEPEPEPYVPTVMPTPRQPFINERPQVAPEPEVVPLEVPRPEPAPPRRFAPLASIEPEDNAADEPSAEPAYEDTVEVKPSKSQAPVAPLADPELGLPLEDDDLDVPAFIRRKVD